MSFHQRYLKDDFEFFWHKLEEQENFALLRSGDGEYAIMRGRHVVAQEGWQSPTSVSKLGYALIKSLQISNPNLYYGISCPCCDREAYYWYRTHTAGNNLTFSNIWVNINYPDFVKKFPQLQRDVVLIANYRAAGKKLGNLNILKHYPVSDDCIDFWEHSAPELLEQVKHDFGNRNDLLYVVSAGPLSNPIIADLFCNNPNNCYIDFGSSLDGFYREVKTRPYMVPGNTYAIRNCHIDDDPAFCLDVSVVLSAYKKSPDLLSLQLDALEQQSLKPKEILLFQDGVYEGEKVTIPDEVLKRCDKVKISTVNVGVWGRFQYAREASCPFVCVFDDDTIPGTRWLENCHAEMMKRDALYGAVGIIAQNTRSYPNGGYYRVGWPRDGHLPFAQEVDFVGHSWFFHKEWLDDLFAAPAAIQTLKRAGEDMSFSYQLQKRGIPTIVPPHPDTTPELYGSGMTTGYETGNKFVAISAHKENLDRMNTAFQILVNNGWLLMVKKQPVRIFLIKIRLRFTLNPVLKRIRHAGYEMLRSVYHYAKRILHLEKLKK